MAKQKTKKVKKPKLKLTLIIGKEKDALKFTTQAETFEEALANIREQSFMKVKTWGRFILQIGNKKAELEYRPLLIKRTFVVGFAQKLLYKRLLTLMK